MTGMLDGGYRDETRIVHMLQALERIEQETRETSRDKLFFDDRLTMTNDVPALLTMFRKLVAAFPPAPDKPDNIGDFM